MVHVRSMLQCVSVFCIVFQCMVKCYSVLQCVAVCCSVLNLCQYAMSYVSYWMNHVRSALQCIAVCCSVLQCVAASTRCPMSHIEWIMFAVRCSVLQCVAVCCSVLQCVAASTRCPMSHIEWIMFAVRCSALQCVAVLCTYASVAVCFPSGPEFFFHAAQLCGKMSKKKLSQQKKTYQKLSQSHRLKLFSTLHRTEDSECESFWSGIQT